MRQIRKICFFGTYRDYYSRNRCLIKDMESLGIEVVSCHAPFLARTPEGMGSLFNFRAAIGLAARAVFLYAGLALRYLRLKDVDLILVGYIGHADMVVAWCLGFLTRKPVLFDAFISLYDTIVVDRGLCAEGSLKARALSGLDRLSCRLADRVWLDTPEHCGYFIARFGVPSQKLAAIPLGVDESLYRPADRRPDPAIFSILHYGYFSPLQGMAAILEAAGRLLAFPEIRFTLVGEGQEFASMEEAIRTGRLSNIRLLPLQPEAEIVSLVAGADLCLGVFGGSEKRDRVIPNKVFQALAMGKPVITARSQAVARHFHDRKHLLFCEPLSGESLASAILELKNDRALASRIAEEGCRCFKRNYSRERIAALVSAELAGVQSL